MSLYRGYMELGWVDPMGTAKIACGCRARGNKGRKIEKEVDCNGSFETCCEEACGKDGRYVWDGKPSRIVHRPEFARTHDADDIASQNYVPGIGTYFSRYVFAWQTPHPAEPYDLALTRGKIVIGGTGAAFLAARFGGPLLFVTGRYGLHYGRSALSGAYRNPATVDTAGKVTVGVLNGLAGVQDPLPDATDMGMAAKPIREAAEEVLKASDDFIIAGKKWYHRTDLDSAIDMTQNGLSREKWRARSPIDRKAPGFFVTPKLSDAESYATFRGGSAVESLSGMNLKLANG